MMSDYKEVEGNIGGFNADNIGMKEIAANGDGDGVKDNGNVVGSNMDNWTERIKISIAKSRKIKGGNYVQIATIESDTVTGQLQPKCRTVVFRGFLPLVPSQDESTSSIALKMITDARSEKVTHITNNDGAEMVWWFSQSSEQYRISGKCRLIGESSDGDNDEEAYLGKERITMWKNLSDPAREQFYWLDPGQSYAGAPSTPAGGRSEEGVILPPPSNFLLLLLIPSKIHYLRLRDNYAQKCSWEGGGVGWVSRRVNP